ncbi:glycoside hydrolase [Linderina pennispora]|uniref:mannan endo-1,4-beta-mannosidase n=1 Tax=Linderina pennispora TaxID=61395 RepID=A0A1Y1W0I6_9FUNG|nr:glycoside hydrolase [Linderina pennispora]ORX67028.1 glycoside hydrolase [Linderina pennispora]
MHTSVLSCLFLFGWLTPVAPSSCIEDKPYHVSGANYWQAMNLGMASGQSSNRLRVHQDLRELQRQGINMVRIMASSEGSQFGTQPDRMYPALMVAPGEYDEDVFQGLDWFMAQLPKYKMKAIVTLSNYWTWSGGAAQYVSWATNTTIPYPEQWDHLLQQNDFLKYTNQFYQNESIIDVTQKWYRNHVKALMNEPQITDSEDSLFKWIDESAKYISSLAPRHLVSNGAESKNGQQWFNIMHKSPYITLASCHFWPLNWGYYNRTDPTEASIDYSIHKLNEFISNLADWAAALNKPVGLFEYGMMHDNWGEWAGLKGYSPDAPFTHRNKFYQAVADKVSARVADKQFVGAAFWAYAGMARPPTKPTTEISWVGDPPHEPPGWYSIYDKDVETLAILREFSKKIGAK